MYYKYKVLEVISVYDGDTMTVRLDLGFGISSVQKVRLYGIDTPEIRGDEKVRGEQVRDWLKDHIKGADLALQTIKDKRGKYGRLLGILYRNEDQKSVNALLIDKGLAKIY
jgi:micrococcal nuclease